ncbi:E2 [Puffin papillomavirus 1]|uniref:Regulatory protein E2 n=1 Tax=Puffin papillomavirus 1 TaxID=2562557 RepID=A0AAE5YMU2_9PAPI|nr:E2 [Puffin papillomavirus 1]
MANLQAMLEQMQDRESSLLEKDDTTLDDAIEYWRTVKQIQLLFVAAGRQGHRSIGRQRVPPVHVSEKQAKDAIQMLLLGESLSRGPYGRLHWTLEDLSPILYASAPEGLKRNGRTVRVIYCGNPDTETSYTYWTHIYKYDALTGTWYEARGGMDDVGLWYMEGDALHYYTKWEDEGRQHCGRGAVTWTFRGRNVRGNDVVDTVAPPELSPPRLESTRISDPTPSPPELSRYTPGPPAKRPREAAAAPRGSRTGQTRGGRGRTRPSTGRGHGGSSGRKGTSDAPIAPDAVGSVHHTVPTGTGRVPRLQRLLQDAEDPVGLCFEGRTGQLKTIRWRIQQGNYRVDRVSTTWRWAGRDGEDKSKIIVTFANDGDRAAFMRDFRTGASGVRLFHVNLFGL